MNNKMISRQDRPKQSGMSAEQSRAIPGVINNQPNASLEFTDMRTFFTDATGETKLFYTSQNWVQVTLILETAGPVAISTQPDISPVLSGKGRLLITNALTIFTLPRGSSLYIAANAINRVSMAIEPYPFANAVIDNISNVANMIGKVANAFLQRLTR